VTRQKYDNPYRDTSEPDLTVTELRKDVLTEDWVIIAGDRHGRPRDFSRHTETASDVENCPFEPGNESQTPPEIDAIRPEGADRSDWSVRVVPNKYSALSPEENELSESESNFPQRKGIGSHEVIVESREHRTTLGGIPPDQMNRVLKMYRRRFETLLEDDRFNYVQFFRNEGPEAGASMRHPHSQILALPLVPSSVRERLRISADFFSENDHCIVCDQIERERSAAERVLEVTEQFLVFCPYASRFPYETWFVPRGHDHDFRNLNQDQRNELAQLLPYWANRLAKSADSPPFNLIIHTVPGRNADPSDRPPIGDHFHWFFRLVPRMKRMAGLELATRTHINTVPPERAADELKG
jgi:UDPglucose--hexose-1-phosphate uridylyltransferase